MSSRRLRRSGYPRRRRGRGFLWTLLGLLTLGAFATLFASRREVDLFPEDAGATPVLFLHSLAGNGGQWALQLDHLRRHRRAVALDLRGHGESDPAEDGDYSIAAMAGDVAAAADQL